MLTKKPKSRNCKQVRKKWFRYWLNWSAGCIINWAHQFIDWSFT